VPARDGWSAASVSVVARSGGGDTGAGLMSGGDGLSSTAERVALRGGLPEAGPFGGPLHRRSEAPARSRSPGGAGV